MPVRSLMVGLSLSLVMLYGCGESEKTFKRSFEKSFVKACTENNTKAGSPEVEATELCSCVGKNLVDTCSVAQLAKLTNADAPETQKIMEQALNACRKE